MGNTYTFNTKKGKEFLITKDAQPSMFDFLNPDDKEAEYDNGVKEQNPFNEIKKYEIWSWATGYTFKPLLEDKIIQLMKCRNSSTPVNLFFQTTVKDHCCQTSQ